METTYNFYSDSETHPFFPNKKNVKLFLSNIWKVLIPVVPTPVIKGIKAIDLFNFEYFDEVLVITTIGCILFAVFHVGRTCSINKEIKQSKAIHEAIHNSRNSVVKIQTMPNTDSEVPSISEICSDICDATLKMFKARKSGDIGVAIRLSGCDRRHMGCYSTVRRAGNLSLSREQTHLKKSEGVAKILLDQNKNGCIIFPNIHKAPSTEFVTSSNEVKFKDEVKSMIAAPLCVHDGNGGEMIGILHISSSKEKVFNQDDVALAKALADLAAAMIFSKNMSIKNSSNVVQTQGLQQSPVPPILIASHHDNSKKTRRRDRTRRR